MVYRKAIFWLRDILNLQEETMAITPLKTLLIFTITSSILVACMPIALVMKSEPLSQQISPELLGSKSNILLLTINYSRGSTGDERFLSHVNIFTPQTHQELYEQRGGASVFGLATIGGGFGGSKGVYGFILLNGSGDVIYLGSCKDGQCFIKRRAFASEAWLNNLELALGRPYGLTGPKPMFGWDIMNELNEKEIVKAQQFIRAIDTKYNNSPTEWIDI